MSRKERKSVWKAKGTFGYISSEKKRRLLITIGLFVLPMLVLAGGIWYYKTRNNICTVLAIVGCLPGCRSIVNLIMIGKCHPMDESLYREISAHQGNLDMGYEMYMTFYEKNAYIDAVAVCGNLVVAYSSDPKIDVRFMEENIQKVIRKNGYKAEVHIFTDLRKYTERLDSMNDHADSLREGIRFKPDEKYPDLSREQLILHTFYALCL